jgi:DNA polymerase-3 subunit gamma/tau
VEMGYDLRLVCRELSRVVRDLLVLNVDPSRASDPEIAGENERDRVTGLGGRFSREDLLRAFDLLARAEFDIRGAAQPRYHLEMALLRWIHLRKLVPLEDLIAGAASAKPVLPRSSPQPASSPTKSAPATPAPRTTPGARAYDSGDDAGSGIARPERVVPRDALDDREPGRTVAGRTGTTAAVAVPPVPSAAAAPSSSAPSASSSFFKDAFLTEVRKSKFVFYNTVVAQAQKIEVTPDRVTFSFSPSQSALRVNCEQNRAWLESAAEKVAGRKVRVTAVQAEPSVAPSDEASTRQAALRDQALADAGVQALLEVFPAEIRDVEEM